MKKYVVLFVVLVFLVIASGCTQSPAPPQPATTITTLPKTTVMPTITTSPTLQTTTSEFEKNKITINRTGFYPASLTVKSGSSVRWVNADSTEDYALYNPTHRIALANIQNFQLLAPGESCSHIFIQPGSYDYSDMIHTDMRGTVIVV
jgi:plastocyanin